MLAEFMKPGADHFGLSKQLKPTTADYKALFDAPTAAKIDGVYTKEWDAGNMIVSAKPGQTELKLASATTAELKAGTGNASEFPGGYRMIGPHLVGKHVWYRFKFVEPGKESGMTFDGLVHVNGHWVLVPKPFRGLDEHSRTH